MVTKVETAGKQPVCHSANSKLCNTQQTGSRATTSCAIFSTQQEKYEAYTLRELALPKLCSGQHIPRLSLPGFMELRRLHVLGLHTLLALLQNKCPC